MDAAPDIATAEDIAAGAWYDETAADRVVWFIETYLTHTKGEYAGAPFILEDWQRQIVRDLFGWKRSDGTRLYRRALIYVPRKNGKSTLGAAIATYLLVADGEPGAEIYSAAADRSQAGIVFEQTKQMIAAAPAVAGLCKIYKAAIVVDSTLSSYRVLSADVATKHGLNAHGVLFDELHTQRTRDLWDTLTTAQGSRRQPLVIALTTAGYDPESIEAEVYQYAKQVADGTIVDPEFYAAIYEAPADADWQDPATWAAANPNYGVSLSPDYMAAEARRAANSPAYQNTFKRLLLNIRTNQASQWIDLAVWDNCASAFTAEDLAGAVCYGGLDLANVSDLAAFALAFPNDAGVPGYRLLVWFWVPEANVVERSRQQRAPYDSWIRDGYIKATPGNVIDHEIIAQDIERLAETYQIVDIAFDRWGSVQISNRLAGAGLTMIQFGQGYASMSAPTKELYRLLLAGELEHNGDPVLRWNIDNVVVDQDPAGNLKPNKTKARQKIDGAVASIMAIGRALRHAEDTGNAYDDNELFVI